MVTKRVMARKELSENIGKIKSMNKFVMQKGEEIIKWRANNVTQKTIFFTGRQGTEITRKNIYCIFTNVPRTYSRRFLDHLRKSDRYDKATKAVLKKVIGNF